MSFCNKMIQYNQDVASCDFSSLKAFVLSKLISVANFKHYSAPQGPS